MEKKLLHELRSTVEFMSSAERRIARVILADPERFTKYTLGELAQISGVAQGSIINFSKKYGDGGFPDLKLAVARALTEEGERPFSAVESHDSMKAVLQKTSDGICAGLKNTVALNSAESLECACRMILEAKKVEIYGIFRSAVVATDMYYQLIQLGLSANFVSDVLTCAVSASLLDSESLVVAISSSGETRDVIDAVKLAKDNGARVVAITGHKDSPLAELADVVLLACPGGNAVSETSNQIRLSQLAIVDSLVSEIRNKTDSDSGDRYFKISKILSMHSVRD